MSADAQDHETELAGLGDYGQPGSPPLLRWLPLFAGILASTIVAVIVCPVPRKAWITAQGAAWIALLYVGFVVAAGVAALSVGVYATRSEQKGFALLPRGAVAALAWLAPLMAFYRRDSLWLVLVAAVCAASFTRLLHRHYTVAAEPGSDSTPSRLPAMFCVGLLVQGAVASVAGDLIWIASLCTAGAIALLVWFRQSDVASARLRMVRSASSIVLAWAFAAASLTPYLTASRSGDRDEGLVEAALSFWHRLWNEDVPQIAGNRKAEPTLGHADYPELQALFGQANAGRGATPAKDGSFTALILWPETQERARLVPPSPRRPLLKRTTNLRASEPTTIPFYGVYWFYKKADKTMPADADVSHGDPSTMSIYTTDFSPMEMEARQNFGTFIDLSCCKAIEVGIANGDRQPGSVSLELILVNTKLARRASLGILPVITSWKPGDRRPALAQVLSFSVGTPLPIQSFDEVLLRFILRSSRDSRSAKIAVERFRLLPRF